MFRMTISNAVFWIAILSQPKILIGQTSSTQSTYVPNMTFDVVSIRESRGENFGFMNIQPKKSYLHAELITPFTLILDAYDLTSYDQLENAPEWAKTTNYDVTGKSDLSADQALAKLSDKDSQAEQDHMLQVLLADRFKLRIHPKGKRATTYELFATSRTAKLMTPFHGDSDKTVSTCGIVPSKAGLEMNSKGCPYSTLLGYLSQALGSTVVDHTGLSGMYVFDIKWGWSKVPEGEETYPNILFAIPQQLGLEVRQDKVSAKGSGTVWVVDHIERPTPN
jgi:uncharacterized protein (TIGR03435 family)